MKAENRIFAAILGTNPQIVTESIFAIIKKDPTNAPTAVYVMSTSVGIQRCIEKLIKDNWLEKVYQHFNLKSPEFTRNHCITFTDNDGSPLEDIRNYQESENAADTIFNKIAEWCESENSQLHLSVGGGRKSLDLHAGLAMNICSRQIDRMSQVLVSDPRIENNPDFFFPSQPVNQQIKTFKGEIIDSRKVSVDLIHIDYIRLRGNLPKGAFCSGKSRLEIIAMGRRIFEKQTLEIDYPNSSIIASGEIIKLSTAPFAIFSWIIEEKLKGKPVAITAYQGSADTIKTALSQSYSFKAHLDNTLDKFYSTDPRTDKTLEEIERILIGDKPESSHKDRLTGVKKWAEFKTKNINRVKTSVQKNLKDVTLTDLFSIKAFNAQGQAVHASTSESGIRHDIDIPIENITILNN